MFFLALDDGLLLCHIIPIIHQIINILTFRRHFQYFATGNGTIRLSVSDLGGSPVQLCVFIEPFSLCTWGRHKSH